MCAIFFYQAATGGTATDKFFNTNHPVDCDGIVVFCLLHEDYSFSVFTRLPMKSANGVMAMFAIARDSIGNNAQFLLSCASELPCCAANLEAFCQPTAYAKPQNISDPTYRSLAAGLDSVLPKIELPPGKYVANRDGSHMFVLPTADILVNQQDLELGTGRAAAYNNIQDYHNQAQKACVRELLRLMQANGVPWDILFALNEDATPADIAIDMISAVHPMAYITFIDELMANLSAEHDMVVCTPPIVDGKPDMRVAFSVLLHYPTFRRNVPLLGLKHNDIADTGATCKVQGNYFIISNVNLKGVIEREDMCMSIETFSAEQFHPSDGEVPTEDFNGSQDSESFNFNPQFPRFFHEGIDYSAWRKACSDLQANMKEDVWDKLSTFCISNDLPGFATDQLFATNLVSFNVPKDTTGIFCERLICELTATKVVKNMRTNAADLRAKEAAESELRHKSTAAQRVDLSGGL